ncbi:chromosome condensation regulator RCC1 repeat protein [Medicago truncatula]|uniref:Chromosome condensation regulator RCC1 repeat protein n=1 Tax=Medicago truncatula TaxID=3880 RepID=G7LEZ4_MEDTR|nr:chromosome condensation regulator RCC1 repeat protein [Medicago truncatula]
MMMIMSEKSASPPHVLLISAGASHTVALLTGNVVCSWGRGEDGQLGHGDTDDRLLPTKLSAFDGQDIVSVTCGADYTVARSKSGKDVYSWGCWGRNQNGELGLGTTKDSHVPQKILAFEGIRIKMVAAGAEHSVAITEDGDLYGWGWGRYGNLGLGDTNDRLIPEKVNIDGDKIVMVSCGWRHTISISSSGGLYTHGWSKYGQLGHGDFEDCLVPRKVQALSDKLISQVSGGWRHSMALTSNGQLFGWGWNKFGQIGIGHNFDCSSPMLVNFPHAQKVVQMSSGWRHTVAVTDRANVYSWGRGANGQLGHGDTKDRNVPTIIDAFSVDGCSEQHIESSNYPLPGSLTGLIFVIVFLFCTHY